MKVISFTGVTDTPEYKVNKSTQALLIRTTASFDELALTTIDLSVVKANGNNIIIASKLKLHDFIIGSTYGGEAIHTSGTFKTVAICELTDGDGAFPILDNENIIFSFSKCDDTKTFEVYAMDDPLTSGDLVKFDQKVLLTEEPSKTFQMSGYDLLLIDNSSNALESVTLYYSNGTNIQYPIAELDAMMKDIDPVALIDSDGAVKQNLGRIVVPLSSPVSDLSIDKIDFYKNTAGSVPLVLRSTEFHG